MAIYEFDTASCAGRLRYSWSPPSERKTSHKRASVPSYYGRLLINVNIWPFRTVWLVRCPKSGESGIYISFRFFTERTVINPLTPNDPYIGRTAPLTSKLCILYIYSTNIGTEYFKHGIYSPFFPLQNAVCFIILMYLVSALFTFYIQGVLKLKNIIPAPKG